MRADCFELNDVKLVLVRYPLWIAEAATWLIVVPEPKTAPVPEPIEIPSVLLSVRLPVVAELIEDPFPCISPFTEVNRVIAGVVVGLEIVPHRPLAVMTESEVTVPCATLGVFQEGSPLVTVRI